MKPTELARLFAVEAPRLLRRLRRFRGRVAAEDVVQAAFEKMLGVDEAEILEPRAYLAQVTMNLARDEMRRDANASVADWREDERLRMHALQEITPELMVIEGERFAFMTGTVLALPERERMALLLFKLKGLSHEEIGLRLGVSRHSVPRYLARALAKVAAARQAFERAEGCEIVDDGATGKTDRT